VVECGWCVNVGIELEFIVFCDIYEDVWWCGYCDMELVNFYNVDYLLFGGVCVEFLLCCICNLMVVVDMIVEDVKGECNFG